MWLLSTNRLELRFFDRVDQVPGGYAILSHVWHKPEQTFQSLQLLQESKASYTHPIVTHKVRECVRTAKAYGLDWLWIDAGCINQTSSAELSEAINSMYSWYAEAKICFAYLQDVPSSCRPDTSDLTFRRSRWFTRGWTLQELIAPKCLIFLSSDWTYLGTKASLAPLLAEITGIDVEVLTFRRELRQVSVARRMSWASQRETTRPEDEAYSLMGIFGIVMPTIYGEGREAFRRLQEEIMKHSPDQSLFAWGLTLPAGMLRSSLGRDIWNPASTLFGRSPKDFAASSVYRPVLLTKLHDSIEGCIDVSAVDVLNDPNFSVVNSGVRCQLVVVDLEPFALAILACQSASGECIGLLVHRRRGVDGNSAQFLVGAIDSATDIRAGPVSTEEWTTAGRPEGYRLVHISPSTIAGLLERGDMRSTRELPTTRAAGISKEIHIAHSLSLIPPHPWMRLREREPQKIILPPWFSHQLRRYGFARVASRPMIVLPEEEQTIDEFPYTVRIANDTSGETFVIHLERYHLWLCAAVSILPYGFAHLGSSLHYLPRMVTSRQLPKPRAFEEESLGNGSHPSSLQHCVRFWPDGSKAFGDADRTVRLTVTRWPTADCYCLDVVLEGDVYVPQPGEGVPGNATQRPRTAIPTLHSWLGTPTDFRAGSHFASAMRQMQQVIDTTMGVDMPFLNLGSPPLVPSQTRSRSETFMPLWMQNVAQGQNDLHQLLDIEPAPGMPLYGMVPARNMIPAGPLPHTADNFSASLSNIEETTEDHDQVQGSGRERERDQEHERDQERAQTQSSRGVQKEHERHDRETRDRRKTRGAPERERRESGRGGSPSTRGRGNRGWDLAARGRGRGVVGSVQSRRVISGPELHPHWKW